MPAPSLRYDVSRRSSLYGKLIGLDGICQVRSSMMSTLARRCSAVAMAQPSAWETVSWSRSSEDPDIGPSIATIARMRPPCACKSIRRATVAFRECFGTRKISIDRD
jgi:hypothetical protein